MNIIKVNFNLIDNEAIAKASLVLRNGGVIVYPTDTAYAIGVDACNKDAVEKLYKIKGRDYLKPTHVVMRDWEMIEKFTFTNTISKILFNNFMPGALTMVLPMNNNFIPTLLTGGRSTLGVRIPNCQFTLKLSSIFENPYTTTSANRNNEATPYSLDEVTDVLDVNNVDLIIDGGLLKRVKPSTIVDLTSLATYSIIREGPISKMEIEDTINSLA